MGGGRQARGAASGRPGAAEVIYAEFGKVSWPAQGVYIMIDSPCECEHNNPDPLDARLFPSVMLAVAPAVTMDEASERAPRVHPLSQ